MFERYCSSAMREVWSERRRYERWRCVELEVLRARADLGELPAGLVESAEAVPAPAVEAVSEAERTTRHDVVAFLRTWTQPMPSPVADWVHRDLTSSDIVETAQAMAIQETTELLDAATTELMKTLRDHALAHRTTVRLGRTHGRAAEPDVWGHRVADFALAVARCRKRLRSSCLETSVAKVSGPVGRYSRLDRRIEELAAARLGLQPVSVATQVVMRDSLASWTGCLAVLSGVCEAIALEVRHGQREEVGELFEPIADQQIASSSMPHKRNPVTCEKVCGLARVVRSLVAPVTEGVALWHERDISHSSVERICLPQVAALTEHQLLEVTRVLSGLDVDAPRMLRNVRAAGVSVLSSALLSFLLDQGLSRTEAEELLRRPDPGAAQTYEDAVLIRFQRAGLDLPEGDLLAAATAAVQNSRTLDGVFDHVAEL